MEIFRNYYGPVVKAFEALDAAAGAALETDINALLDKFNVAERRHAGHSERISRSRHHQERGLIPESTRAAIASATTSNTEASRNGAPGNFSGACAPMK